MCPHAGAGEGGPVDVRGGSRGGAHHYSGQRALRFAVLWRRMRHGRDHEKGDRWVERLLSRRETCRLRGRPPFPVLVDAVPCSFHGQQPDVSWI